MHRRKALPLVWPADDAMLEKIQRATFEYFQENQEPSTGLVFDRSALFSPASVAACGFAMAAYCVAAERGWVSREKASRYCHRVMSTLYMAPQGVEPFGCAGYRGFFFHFVDPKWAIRACDPKFWPQLLKWYDKPPESIPVELSSIDTAIFISGCLLARNYFDRAAPLERTIRNLASSLYERVEWEWMLSDEKLMRMGWKPESGLLDAKFEGFTEGFIVYLLALGSPTHPIGEGAWQAQLRGVVAEEFFGQKLVKMRDFPQFGYQFPLCFFNLKGIRDDTNRRLGFDWFANAARATSAQYRYAVNNPHGFRGYGPRVWGLSASDGPGDFKASQDGRTFTFYSYGVRGPGGPDDGTIAPHAVAASLPFAPKLVIATLKAWVKERKELFTATGLVDAFNPTADPSKPSGWVASEQLGIDQGPIVSMIENYRSGLIWRCMMQDADVQNGLRRAGFSGGWLERAS
jgi:hypothetical protein